MAIAAATEAAPVTSRLTAQGGPARLADVLRYPVGSCNIEIGHDDRCAFLRQAKTDGPADPVPSAGYERHAVSESLHVPGPFKQG